MNPGTAPRIRRLAALAVALLLALPALAGEAGYRKCSMDTQSCLNAMVGKLKGRGWLGIEYDDSQGPRNFRVTRVVPGSPAESAGFKAGDILVSVKGAKFADNTEDRCVTCDATKDDWKPGSRLDYVVRRGGRTVTLRPTLASLPSDVMAQMVGMHMLEHVQPSAPPK